VFHGGRVVRLDLQPRRSDRDWTALQLAAIHAGLELATRQRGRPGAQAAEPIVVVTQSTWAAAFANGERHPRKPAIQEALRALQVRFRPSTFRVEVVPQEEHPAPGYGFQALRQRMAARGRGTSLTDESQGRLA
jgi:hypothetical protein